MVKQYNFKSGKFIVYFTTPNCVYCKAFNNTWEAFVAKLKTEEPSVEAVTLSTKDNYNIISDSPDVFAYPTVYAFNNGKYTEFNEQRSMESLMHFTQQNLLLKQNGGGRRRSRRNRLRHKRKTNRRTSRRRSQRGGSRQMSAPFSYSPPSLLSQPSAPPCAQHNGAPVDVQSTIPPAQQSSGPNHAMPPPSYNAGLYTGPPFEGPWGNVPVTPTAAGTTHDALRSANPPPGATRMYATGGTNRPGNSFSAKPGVNHYNGGHGGKMYTIKCTGPKGGRRRRRKSRSKRRGGLNLRSLNMDDGAPFHPTWSTLSAPHTNHKLRGGV